MVVANMTGLGSSAPYSKFPIVLSPPGVFPPQGSHSNTESIPMTRKTKSVEGAPLMDVDSPMDGIDGVDDTDSYGSDFSDPPEYPLDSISVELESKVVPEPTPTHGSPQVELHHPPSRAEPVSVNDCIVS